MDGRSRLGPLQERQFALLYAAAGRPRADGAAPELLRRPRGRLGGRLDGPVLGDVGDDPAARGPGGQTLAGELLRLDAVDRLPPGGLRARGADDGRHPRRPRAARPARAEPPTGADGRVISLD